MITVVNIGASKYNCGSCSVMVAIGILHYLSLAYIFVKDVLLLYRKINKTCTTATIFQE